MQPERAPKRKVRPPFTVMSFPKRRDGLKAGLALSIALHALIILLIIAPPLAARFVESPEATGAGGAGPAGGGGGGVGGQGGGRELQETIPERLRYLQMQRQQPPAPVMEPEVPAEEVPPPVEEPEPVPEEPPVPQPQEIDIAALLPEAPRPSVVEGVGGGSGRDGSAGMGPGSGGGIGSGIGTGTGSAVGPGTGGGDAAIYPPTPVEVLIPPMPVPNRLRGITIVALFDVDSSGRVMSVDFEPTRNRGYDRDLRERLRRYRFRPAVRPDGTPVRATVPIPIRL